MPMPVPDHFIRICFQERLMVGQSRESAARIAHLMAFVATRMPFSPAIPFDGSPLFIRDRVVDVLQRWHEMNFLPAKFPFEDAEVRPCITRLAFWGNAK